MAVGANDWLVADSEDEDAHGQLLFTNGIGASAATRIDAALDVSTIQTAVFTPDRPRTPPPGCRSPSMTAESLFTPPSVEAGLTISDLASVPSVSAELSTIAPRARPRPRVVMKKAMTSNPYLDVASTSFSHISDHPVSATRQTDDSIHPVTTTSVGFSDAVEDAFSSFDIAERAKMRSRKSQVAKKPIQPPAQINEVIELTSDEDEFTLKPMKRQKKRGDPVPNPKAQTKPRPKPRLKVKPAAAPLCDPPLSPTVIQNLSASAPPPQCGSSSQLPASTLPTIPPSTPPQARELTPLSSPVATAQKRKRICPSIAEDGDEMDTVGGGPTEAFLLSTVPPPFFAPPSSSVPTDSGIEIPSVESTNGRGKKKQGSSSKKGTQKRAQNKGKKGGKGELTTVVDETVQDFGGVIQEPSTPAPYRNPSFSEERHPPVVKDSTATEKTSGKQTAAKKGKARVIDSEDEDELLLSSKSNTGHPLPAHEEGQRSKENLQPGDLSPPKRDPPKRTSTPSLQVRDSSVKSKSTPMSELIRRVNSQPSSPFPNASRTYSPFLKSSRTMLTRIAPLHPNRRTPPPPLPRPPPPKKSKKQLEMEERIEEELSETIDGWSCLTDDERKVLRKARIDAELGYEE